MDLLGKKTKIHFSEYFSIYYKNVINKGPGWFSGEEAGAAAAAAEAYCRGPINRRQAWQWWGCELHCSALYLYQGDKSTVPTLHLSNWKSALHWFILWSSGGENESPRRIHTHTHAHTHTYTQAHRHTDKHTHTKTDTHTHTHTPYRVSLMLGRLETAALFSHQRR